MGGISCISSLKMSALLSFYSGNFQLVWYQIFAFECSTVTVINDCLIWENKNVSFSQRDLIAIWQLFK